MVVQMMMVRWWRRNLTSGKRRCLPRLLWLVRINHSRVELMERESLMRDNLCHSLSLNIELVSMVHVRLNLLLLLVKLYILMLLNLNLLLLSRNSKLTNVRRRTPSLNGSITFSNPFLVKFVPFSGHFE